MITSPVTPKLSAQLDAWAEPNDGVLEIDQSLVEQADFTGATRINVDGSKLVGVTMTGAILEKFECSDTEWIKLEAAAVQAYRTNLLRVTMTDCRLTGAEFAEGHFEDCVFKNVKFDEAGFRMVEVPVSHYPRLHGRSQFFRLPHLSQTLKGLLRIWWSLVISRWLPVWMTTAARKS